MIPPDRKQRIGRAFSGAGDYDRAGDVQRIVAGRLADRIAATPLADAPSVLELGCGTGFLTRALIDQWPDARWIVSDIAPEMVARAKAQIGPRADYHVIDAEAPPFEGAAFDLICSSLAFQWCGDLRGTIARLSGLLRPGGLLAFSTMAAGSFAAWRAAHEAEGLVPGTPDFPTLDAIRAMVPNGFAVDACEEAIPRPPETARAFLRHLKAIGAGVPIEGRVPLTPRQLRTVMAAYDVAGVGDAYCVGYCLVRALP